MTAQPLSWHEQLLENAQRYLAEIERAAERQAEQHRMRIEKLRADIDLHQRQIAEAKRRKMDRFDSDRLLKGKDP